MKGGFDPDDELPRPFPATEPSWQENIYFSWYDTALGIGGLHRLGQWTNQKVANYWSGILTEAGLCFRRCDLAVPLHERDRNGGISVGPYRHCFDGATTLSFAEPEVQGELRFTDFHAPARYWHAAEDLSMSREFAADHYEASGQVQGRVRIGDQTYEVGGLGHRDHSWGARTVDSVSSHRWLSGTFGPQLSWSAVTAVSASGEVMNRGFVVRDGVPTTVETADLMPYCETDGITHRGGWGRLAPPGEPPVVVTAHLTDAFMFGLGPEEPEGLPAFYGASGA